MDKKNEAADAAQAAKGSGENGGGTSITTTGTGEREEQRRACCTSEAVPAPPGKAITSTEALNAGEGVGLGLHQGLLQQEAIADGPGSAAMAAPISGEGLDPPAELMGGTADGAISATGTAMEQQMDRPTSTALEESGGDALLGPDEITATSGDDDDRAMGQRRRRQEAKGRQCSGLGHCSRGQAHGLQSKRTGQVARGFLMIRGAAGDGLVAFGAALILPVQTH